jgi:hypothetical protein
MTPILTADFFRKFWTKAEMVDVDRKRKKVLTANQEKRRLQNFAVVDMYFKSQYHLGKRRLPYISAVDQYRYNKGNNEEQKQGTSNGSSVSPKKAKRKLENAALPTCPNYEPVHFLRCHSYNNDPADSGTKIWRCAFQPKLEETSNCCSDGDGGSHD